MGEFREPRSGRSGSEKWASRHSFGLVVVLVLLAVVLVACVAISNALNDQLDCCGVGPSGLGATGRVTLVSR